MNNSFFRLPQGTFDVRYETSHSEIPFFFAPNTNYYIAAGDNDIFLKFLNDLYSSTFTVHGWMCIENTNTPHEYVANDLSFKAGFVDANP